MLTEGKGNMEWMAEKGGYDYQLRACFQPQKQGLQQLCFLFYFICKALVVANILDFM